LVCLLCGTRKRIVLQEPKLNCREAEACIDPLMLMEIR
jgi:hypothetical protein